MKKYVLGFLFQDDGVWLINKNKPEWQKGKLNGIGGKIEDGETPFNAMIREFKEETGLEINSWKWFCTITDDELFQIYCYYSFSYSKDMPTTTTDEVVEWVHLKGLPSNILSNIHWLIPMALSFESGEHCDGFHVIEKLNKNVVAEIISR